ncbi:MAG: hypothetical protein V4510_13150 [bacterium]
MATQKAKRPWVRPGDLVLLAWHKKVIPPFDGKPFVGHEDVLRVASVSGTGSLKNPYRVVVTDGVHAWHLEPDDVRPAEPAPVAAPEKSHRQLEAEIDALAGTGEVTVVAAWTEDVQEIAPGQKPWRHDLGERPKLVDAKKPHAAMWVNQGTRADVAKALAFVRKDYPATGRVFVYPTTEGDPLGRARRDVLR